MISICIPIYNFDVRSLVNDLLNQGNKLNVPFELILIDDCSQESFKKINKLSCEKAKYIELEKNIGRSKIRNLFLEYAQFENLLFLDCDAIICNDNFIKLYISCILEKIELIVCGGRIYPTICPSKNQRLSWKYGLSKESKSAKERILLENNSFMTNNFLISKELLSAIGFNENIVIYGHEDTLYGIELLKKGIKILHIENPVLNGDIENNQKFLEKTEIAIKSLLFIQNEIDSSKEFRESIKLIQVYDKLNRFNVAFVPLILFKLFGKSVKNHFLKDKANLYLFDFYKLGFYIQEKSNHSK